MARKYDLVICGYYGFDNLGDELICLALIEMALEAGLKKIAFVYFHRILEKRSLASA